MKNENDQPLIGPAAEICARLVKHTRTLRTRPGARLRTQKGVAA